jgi:hypothetical protein
MINSGIRVGVNYLNIFCHDCSNLLFVHSWLNYDNKKSHNSANNDYHRNPDWSELIEYFLPRMH